MPWQDYSIADEIALIPVDTQMTSINLATATEPTFAMSSPVTDSDGTRQAAVMFPVGTTAEMVMPDGSTQPLTNLTVRATEFTVGSGGQMAMPAPLPLNTGYTYAVEFSIDEALAAGADTVNFSQPIPAYVDNFLSFPTGTDVPSAYYDRKKAAWVPTDNGRVIEILSITSGFADLDVDGSGTAANVTLLASLGISDAERQTLASQYGTGSSLWRVPVKHFSTFDWNFPIGFPSDYIFPEQIMASPKLPPDNCTICKGSIIQVEGQILGETIPITGTPFDLNYTSDRLEGYVADKLIIPLMGTQIPASLKRIDLTIDAMGRRFQATYTPQANLTHEFQWDGFDIYGREIMGTTNVKVKIDYAYQAVYQGVKTFGGVTTGVDLGPGRSEIFSVQEYETSVIRLDHRRQGLGGWTLDVNHFYDSQGRILYRGDGNRRSSESINKVITTIAGGGTGNLSGAYYGTATNLNFYRPGVRMGQAETDAEGNFYTMGRQCGAFCNYFIFKIARDGSFEVVAGDVTLTLPYRRPFEGQSARQMRPRRGIKLEKVDNEGNIYFVSDSGSSCCGQLLFQIDTNGIIHHIAGNLGAGGNSADGVPATTAYTKRIRDVDLDSEGNIYIVEEVLGVVRIRKIDQNGIITSQGGGNGNGSGFPAYEEGGLASTGRLLISGNNVSAIAIDSE
ncbi:MAG: hypothetical protein JKY23_05955, partial [Nitrospinaceae bacterium]|nr:hypothetical protein [Nitrospinaceae bacterium]